MKLPRFAPFLASLLAGLLIIILPYGNVFAADTTGLPVIEFSALPLQAQRTIGLIRQDGPFPYEKDGSVFGNYEKRLPQQKRGYYREFTVKTPHLRGRGAKRIIAGGPRQSPEEYFYTADHYKSFKLVVEGRHAADTTEHLGR